MAVSIGGSRRDAMMIDAGSLAVEPARSLANREELWQAYCHVREQSRSMVAGLAPEDFRIQPVADVSPPWWNLGHTSWFFARNVLLPLGGQYGDEDQHLDFVLNSYYVALGPRVERARRGHLTRPTTEQILGYRESVDTRVRQLLDQISDQRLGELQRLLVIGMHHEQQHQELFYTEIKYILGENPIELRPVYRPRAAETPEAAAPEPLRLIDFQGGLAEFGNLEGGWCWDNELPVHQFYLPDFRLQDRLVTNAEFLQFIEDGGYRQPLLWLDNGWNCAQAEGWQAPRYWEQVDGRWMQWTLSGMRPLDPMEPVCHVSFYEADAFARWVGQTWRECRGSRLPTEREWEQAARAVDASVAGGNLLDSGRLHPRPAGSTGECRQMLGDVWEWTASYYEAYPGYRPLAGDLGEYNSKFMDNQRVLRGGSCVTPADHIRLSYRNFWSAPTRFQFTGVRLAADA
jgi:ergothioneine biosynthesis protein EgtB